MICKRCGKSLGTDRGICPFCGAMLSKDQMEVYKQYKKDHILEEKMITERYTGKKVYVEKRENENFKFTFFLLFLILCLFILFVLLFFLLKD